MKSERTVIRFQNEARATSKLSHINVASILDFGVSREGEPYMAMELVEGMTLQRLLSLEKKLELRDCLSISIQICSALAHAHQKGIIHRDVKPANVMIVTPAQGDPIVKVLDFGVAKLFNEGERDEGFTTDPGVIVGSPLYMSPEQSVGEKITPQSDMYALGCLMFHCIAGEPPFVGDTSMDTLMKHRQEAVPSILALLPETPVSEQLAEMVSRLMAKNPDKRFPSAEILKEKLIQIDNELAEFENAQERAIYAAQQEDIDKGYATIFLSRFSPSKVDYRMVGTVIGALFVFGALAIVYGLSRDTGIKAGPTKFDDTFKTVPYDKFNETSLDKTVSGFSPTLSLADPQVTDEDLKDLKNNRNITFIELSTSRVSDKGIDYLSPNSPKLTTLLLNGTLVKNLDSVSKLPKLLVLDLSSTAIIDDSLENLKKLKRLRSLKLNNTNVTRSGVLYLASLPDLILIDVSGCPRVSVDDMKLLANEFPLCDIEPLPGKSLLQEGSKKAESGEHAAAHAMFTTCLQSTEKHFGKDSLRSVPILLALAGAERGLNHGDQSVLLIEKAIRIAAKKGQPQDVIRAADHRVLHALWTKDADRAIALAGHQKQLRKINGVDTDTSEADFEWHIGSLFQSKKDFPNAIKHFKKALTIRENIKPPQRDADRPIYEKTVGPRGINTLHTKIDLGLVYEQSGRADLARRCMEEALPLLPPHANAFDGRYVVMGNISLANCFIYKKDSATARKYNARALEVCRQYPQLKREVEWLVLDQLRRIEELVKKQAKDANHPD